DPGRRPQDQRQNHVGGTLGPVVGQPQVGLQAGEGEPVDGGRGQGRVTPTHGSLLERLGGTSHSPGGPCVSHSPKLARIGSLGTTVPACGLERRGPGTYAKVPAAAGGT